jgi:outer membrane protein assembly factor BamB
VNMRSAATLGVFLVSIVSLAGMDWPQWRGANRDGTSPETGLLKSWPAGGPKQAWKFVGLGAGYASVSVAGGRIYTQGQRGDAQYVVALDEATGRRIWETRHGGPYRERRGDGPRGVPTVDGDMLYALAADGSLSALRTEDGKSVWSLHMVRDFSGRVPNWGYSESPLVHGDRLIVTPGGSGKAIVALDKRTGKTVWSSQSDGAAYSSPVLARVGTLDTWAARRQWRTAMALQQRGEPHREHRHAHIPRWLGVLFVRLWHRLRFAAPDRRWRRCESGRSLLQPGYEKSLQQFRSGWRLSLRVLERGTDCDEFQDGRSGVA